MSQLHCVRMSFARAAAGPATDDYADAVLALGPTAHYQLIEASGDTAYDVSGNNNHGLYVGSRSQGEAGIVDGTPLAATEFTGGYVLCPLFDLALRSFTICAWLEVQALNAVSGGNQLFSYRYDGTTRRNLHCRIEANNVCNLDFGNDARGTDSSLPNWTAGRHFLALRYDASIDKPDVLINAVAVGPANLAGPLEVNGLLFKLFGGYDGSTHTNPLLTRAQHVSIFAGTALTGAQLAGLEAIGAP